MPPAQANQPEHFPGQHPPQEQDGRARSVRARKSPKASRRSGRRPACGLRPPLFRHASPEALPHGAYATASRRSCRKRSAFAFSAAFASRRAASPSAPRRLGLRQHLLERLDEALRVGAKSLMRQPDGVASGERLQALGQLRRARHLRIVHENRNHPLLLRQRRLDLDADEVLRIVETPLARISSAAPSQFLPITAISTSQRATCFVQHLHEVEPRRELPTSMNSRSGGNACSSRLYRAWVKPDRHPWR